MPKIMLHNSEARRALARGVFRLAAAVEPTLGPKGMNAMIDRPIGTPMVTRDGVSIASEIELHDRFENMGAQVVREVSMQTNEVAGDGTTTAIVLANALIQGGVEANERGAKPVDLCKGIDLAVAAVVAALKASAKPAKGNGILASVANIAATDTKLGALVAEAHQRVGAEGVITTDFSVTTETTLDVVEGMSFERGYLSHHMVTDQEKMEAVLERPYILMTDLKIKEPEALDAARRIADEAGRPLLIVSEEMSPEVVVTLLGKHGPGKYLVVHPPEYGHWRKAMMEDLAIITGGKVIARDLGGRLEDITADDLGTADRVKTSSSYTSIIRGGGDHAAVASRRAQVQRQYEASPPNIDQDKLRERLAKLSGGTAILYAGGVTPVEQKRTIQLIEDSLNAVRAACEEGVVAGGGSALAQIAPLLDKVAAGVDGDVAEGVRLVRSVLSRPLWRIAANAGADPEAVVAEVTRINGGYGYNASVGSYQNMFEAGIIDPVRVTYTALANAASVATLILTTETLIGHLAEDEDPTAGPARGGGSEKLGRA
ncbi:molecular chaperone GroEL [Mesorhizobium mediterraneum]|uniref:60 kDa chaperonin n=1 Tax=Mesorhizobium mediterraneum TaxID=43617 RepID=A0AB36R6M2_9HYPH|nr:MULTISPECIES: molecular chaperone GroEL [Mesorhizobium]RUU46595.1 molecular chaperone GroEL [Mesorhizobium sp. M6A.T.Ca.TU.002.02.2.1]PAQ00164.1 molecular chaperone GroEL [Mesorhizobium mediterraneum]RUU31414.1 molecular chaperone GroEL [Mesorhizobium sp. M6A.T.Ce.TU.016.01.1.1]RUU45413.1 molecular chaperone GroEL [Mesorhizobium sp. M6A.T.Ce.TU.002.03.1.1]RUV02781.1 molecular chaperone GroEL [Mesorhizobium sp. M6A.T.Cr.TU.017.01.1.1]